MPGPGFGSLVRTYIAVGKAKVILGVNATMPGPGFGSLVRTYIAVGNVHIPLQNSILEHLKQKHF
jgi:hypothetical protein